MAYEMREMRAFQCEEAAALLQQHGEEPVKTFDAAMLRRIIVKHRGLSLVAKMDDRIVGVALAFRKDGNGFMQYVITDPSADATLARDLADACSAKLVHTAVGKCVLRLTTAEQADTFWRGAQWTDCPEFDEPVRYFRPITDATNPDDPTCPWKPAA